MSFLRGSANYVWCTTSVLGKGATGAVFQVRNLEFQNPGFCETSKSVGNIVEVFLLLFLEMFLPIVYLKPNATIKDNENQKSVCN